MKVKERVRILSSYPNICLLLVHSPLEGTPAPGGGRGDLVENSRISYQINRARKWREMIARKEIKAPKWFREGKKPNGRSIKRAREWREMVARKEVKAPKKPNPRNQNRARKWREAKEKVLEDMKKELARLQKENAELR